MLFFFCCCCCCRATCCVAAGADASSWCGTEVSRRDGEAEISADSAHVVRTPLHAPNHFARAHEERALRSSHCVIVPWDVDTTTATGAVLATAKNLLSLLDASEETCAVVFVPVSSEPEGGRSALPFRPESLQSAYRNVAISTIGPLALGDYSGNAELSSILERLLRRANGELTSPQRWSVAVRSCALLARQCDDAGVFPVLSLRALRERLADNGVEGADWPHALAHLIDTGTILVHRDGSSQEPAGNGIVFLRPSWIRNETQCADDALAELQKRGALDSRQCVRGERQADESTPFHGSGGPVRKEAPVGECSEDERHCDSEKTPSLSDAMPRRSADSEQTSAAPTISGTLSAALANLPERIAALKDLVERMEVLDSTARVLRQEGEIIQLERELSEQHNEKKRAEIEVDMQTQKENAAAERIHVSVQEFKARDCYIASSDTEVLDEAVSQRNEATEARRDAIENLLQRMESTREHSERARDALENAWRELLVGSEQMDEALGGLGLSDDTSAHSSETDRVKSRREALEWHANASREASDIKLRALGTVAVLSRIAERARPVLEDLVADGTMKLRSYMKNVRAQATHTVKELQSARDGRGEEEMLRRSRLSRLRIECLKCRSVLESSIQARDMRADLDCAITEQKMASRRERKMKIELLEYEEDDALTEEAVQAHEQQKRQVAIAQAKVRTIRQNVRNLVVRGCPEAEIFAQIGQGSKTPRRGDASDQKWRSLVQKGIADTEGSTGDYTEMCSMVAASNVYRAPLCAEDRVVVLKRVARGSEDAMFFNEVHVLSMLKHPNILALEKVFRDDRDWFLQFPLMECGDLRKFLNTPSANSSARAVIARDIMTGLSYLHEKQIVHRDLKPENILVSAHHRACLADFAISRREERLLTQTVVDVRGRNAGTQMYAAPEQLRGHRASEASDMYALGLVFYEIVYNRAYDASIEQRMNGSVTPEAVLGKAPKAKSEWEEHGRELIIQLLQHEPRLRPSAHQALAHQFFALTRVTDNTRESNHAIEGETSAGASDVAARHRFEAAVEALRGVVEASGAREDGRPERVVLHEDELVIGVIESFNAFGIHTLRAASEEVALDFAMSDRTVSGAVEEGQASDGGEAEYVFRSFWQRVTAEKIGLFETKNSVMHLPRACAAGEREVLHQLQTVGRILAHCIRTQRRVLLDVAPVFWRILLHGTNSVLQLSCASLLDLMEDFDKPFADGLKQTLDTDASLLMLQTRDVRGVPQELSNASRLEHVRQEALQCLVVSRQYSWEALCEGFRSIPSISSALGTHLEEAELGVFCRVAPVRARLDQEAAAELERHRKEQEEQLAALRAVVREIGYGRTFRCPNGHPYVVGECGGPMEVGRCACGALIGGTNHALRPDNTYAADLSNGERPAYR